MRRAAVIGCLTLVLVGCSSVAGTPVAAPAPLISRSDVKALGAGLDEQVWADESREPGDPVELIDQARSNWDGDGGSPQECFPYYVAAQLLRSTDVAGDPPVLWLSHTHTEHDDEEWSEIVVNARVLDGPVDGAAFLDAMRADRQTCGTGYTAHEGWVVEEIAEEVLPDELPAGVDGLRFRERNTAGQDYRITLLAAANVIVGIETYRSSTDAPDRIAEVDALVVELAARLDSAR